MDKDTKIYVAGHRGLVGSAIMANLKRRGFTNVIGRTHAELDLLDPVAVREFFDKEKPEAVVLAAAHVGGILANSRYRADFIYENLQIQQNVIGEAFRHGVKRLLFLGSTCIYPREAPQPMKEDALLTSPLEYTNEPYAIAKIAGMKMCESFNLQYGTDYVAVMPTNLYGPNDNFHLENSHVLPAMIRKVHLARLLGEKDMDAVRADLAKRNPEWTRSIRNNAGQSAAMGHRNASARIPLERGHGRCVRSYPAERKFQGHRRASRPGHPQYAREHRHRQGAYHRRTGAACRRGHRILRNNRMGRVEARRHNAQIM